MKKGYCPKCGTKLLFAESILEMWCPKCKKYVSQIRFEAVRGVKNRMPIIWTGGLSALESAFDALGWSDPHYLPEQGYTCEVVGCMEEDTTGTHWGESKLYLRLCSEHYHQSYSGVPMPPVKKYALDRETRRGSDGVLREATNKWE